MIYIAIIAVVLAEVAAGLFGFDIVPAPQSQIDLMAGIIDILVRVVFLAAEGIALYLLAMITIELSKRQWIREAWVLGGLAAIFPWELGTKADAFAAAPAGIRPEWYFLFMFQTLKKLPPQFFNIEWLEGEVVGVLFFGFCGLVVLIVPFLDFSVSSRWPRRVLNFLAAAAVAFFVVMTARGLSDGLDAWFSRNLY